MPITFATYAVGMMALSGVPLLFSGFWSKDEILHSASNWEPSRGPFMLLALAALLTAFYMTRQVCYVFFGKYRGQGTYFQPEGSVATHSVTRREPHESAPVMTWPLIVLAVGSVLIGFLGTPLWPWFQSFIEGHEVRLVHGLSLHVLAVMGLSTALVAIGITAGWWLYGRQPIESAQQPDALDRWNPAFFGVIRRRFMVDEFYDATIVRLVSFLSRAADWFDRVVWGGIVRLVVWLVLGLSWIDRLIDEFIINLGFNKGSESFRESARYLSRFQNGRVQRYLRVLGLVLTVLAFFFLWGCRT